jgi:hypothetical protein
VEREYFFTGSQAGMTAYVMEILGNLIEGDKPLKFLGDAPAGEPIRPVIRRPIRGHLRHLR